MKKGLWIVIAVVVVLVIVLAVVLVTNQKGFGLDFSLENVDYSAGTGIGSVLGSSTKENAFEEVETNPFRYENE
jgi:uncharacterized integral membrane protein